MKKFSGGLLLTTTLTQISALALLFNISSVPDTTAGPHKRTAYSVSDSIFEPETGVNSIDPELTPAPEPEPEPEPEPQPAPYSGPYSDPYPAPEPAPEPLPEPAPIQSSKHTKHYQY